MSDRTTYRAGTSSVTVPATLGQAALRDAIRDALHAELAHTGEHLAAFDFGPPRRALAAGMHSYDVMYRTGPRTTADVGPAMPDDPPQVSA